MESNIGAVLTFGELPIPIQIYIEDNTKCRYIGEPISPNTLIRCFIENECFDDDDEITTYYVFYVETERIEIDLFDLIDFTDLADCLEDFKQTIISTALKNLSVMV